jgi:6-phosphogluconolactonase (cycloisomerase 2 family)
LADERIINVSQYTVTVGGNGALTAMTVPTVAAGRTPNSVAVDPSRKYVYVADSNGGTVSSYSIGTDGALTPLAGSPSTGGGSTGWFPIWIVILPKS